MISWTVLEVSTGSGVFDSLVLDLLDWGEVGNILARISFVRASVWVEVVGMYVVCMVEVWVWLDAVGLVWRR